MTTDTPLADAQDKRLANQSDFTSYMSMLDFARTLERDLAECRAALRELVSMADLAAEVISYAAGDGDIFAEPFVAKQTDLARRRPAAWSAARAILAKGEGK